MVMAIDLAEFGFTVNVVSPGEIRTELFLADKPLDDPGTKANLAGIAARRRAGGSRIRNGFPGL